MPPDLLQWFGLMVLIVQQSVSVTVLTINSAGKNKPFFLSLEAVSLRWLITQQINMRWRKPESYFYKTLD